MLCTECKIDKPEDEFYVKKNPAKNWVGRYRQCKACMTKKSVDRVKKDKGKRAAYMKKYFAEMQDGTRIRPGYQLIVEAKKAPCKDCGGSFPPECMDFDHLGDKKMNVSAMKYNSVEKVAEEIAKCDLVCANCHRIRTKKRMIA